MKKLISSLLAIVMVLSLTTIPAFAASTLPFTDSDYLKESFGYSDYKKYETKSIGEKGVDFPEGTTVIAAESVHSGKRNNIGTNNKTANIPDTVVIFGSMAFMGRGLGDDSVDFTKYTNLKFIDAVAFSNNSFTSADLSKTQVVRIGKTAFAGNKKLKTFIAPSTLKRIDDSAFETDKFTTFQLNEGLEYLGYLGLEFSSPAITLPSTLTYISDSNAEFKDVFSFKVTKGTYAEEWCKKVGVKYTYVDGTGPSTPTTPTNPTTPATNFPTMEYTKTIGPVTFSNYVSHQETKPLDANGKTINATWVKISANGSMRADKDNTEFRFWWSGSGGWNANDNSKHKNDITTDSGAWNGDWATVTLKTFNITPYATTKTNGTWSKGLTWQFAYNSKSNNNDFAITVEVNGQKYYYYVSVVADKPTGSATTPTTPTTPATKATANPTSSKVLVNGKAVAFDAYNINNNNYFKLRDVAQILRGTDKQFNVTWDGTKNAINLISNIAYESTGGELNPGDGLSKDSTISNSSIYKDGVEISLTAYNINGNNYFKLRDLGKTFNFSVTWDGTNNTVVINTTQPYTE